MSGCVFRVRLNNLGSIWYTLLSTVVQLYLLYLGLERYKLYTELKWPHGSYPREWLTAYVSLLAICIPLLVLFMAFGVFKSGNLAGDNEHLGARTERIIEFSRRGGHNALRKRGFCFLFCHGIKSVWQHSPPVPQTIHLTLALCQLLAQQLMLAQLYRFGFINSGDFLNTELDFVYQRARQLATNLPMGDTRLQGFRITSEELADSPIAPNLLPILMHARLFGIPLEFVNLLVALIAYSCAYPAVFWRLSKSFSMCFSFHLIIYTVAVIWSYLSFSILFRVQETNYYSSRPVGIGQHLWSLRPLIVYHPLAILGCFVLTIFLMHVTTMVLYAYGYNKYLQSVYKFRRSRGPPSALMNGNGGAMNSSVPGTPSSAAIGRFTNENSKPPSLCCDGFGPHITAISILVVNVAMKTPMLYALGLLLQHEDKPLIFSCVAIDVVYLFSWLLCWIFLSLKLCDSPWRVVHEVREILSLQEAHRTADGNIHNKSISDLKNSLILMHKGHLFVTDDPVAKPSIMRHVLKSCVQDDIYWLRANQSPANRKVPLEDRTNDMGQLLDASSPRLRRDSPSPPVPLAAPPYQRLSSLPPIGTPISAQNNSGSSFGTLQRGMRSEYGTRMMGSPYQSTVGRTSLQSSYNPMHPEAYATIHRSTNRSALSSLSRGGVGDYGIVGLGPTVSPQMTRQNLNTRGSTTSNGSREVIIGGPPIGTANNQIYGQIYESRNSQTRPGANKLNQMQANLQSSNQYGQYGSAAANSRGPHTQNNYDGIVEIRQGSTPLMISSVQMSPNAEPKWKRDTRSATREIPAASNNPGDRLPHFGNSSELKNGQALTQHTDYSSESRSGESRMQRPAMSVNTAKKPPMPSLSQWSAQGAAMPKPMSNSHGSQANEISPTPSSSAAASVSSKVTSSVNGDNSTGAPTPTLDHPVNGEYQTNTLKPMPNSGNGAKPQISPKPIHIGNAAGPHFVYQNGYRGNQMNGNQRKPNMNIYDSQRIPDEPKHVDEFATSVV